MQKPLLLQPGRAAAAHPAWEMAARREDISGLQEVGNPHRLSLLQKIPTLHSWLEGLLPICSPPKP